MADRREFLSKYAAKWNVTRHRIAASIHERITEALDRGRLKVLAGCIERLTPHEQNIEVTVTEKNAEESSIHGDLIINCTGPQLNFSTTPLPLFKSLLDSGLAVTDDLDMGLRVNDRFQVVGADNGVSGRIYALGPLLRGSLWESTAVGELRIQAMRVAESLLEREPSVVKQEDLIEYYI